MAEGIAAGLAQTLITQLGSQALKEIGSAKDVKKEVKRLENTLTSIKDVLPHAENLQLSNNDVKSWLRRIKDAAYEAEDVIDDYATEALRNKLLMQGSICKRVRHFFSPSNPIVHRFKMAHKIKEVRENLNDILDDHQSFVLQRGFKENISEGRQTHSYIPEEKVVGRDADKEKIVKLLLDSSGRDGLSIIPIQGMGGMGKTVLAQLVYNDKRVVDSFMQNRMWVCVPDEFDVQKITENIIKSNTDKECPNLDMDQLQSRLRQYLGGKRYLLVLDDIWNEDQDKWEELKNLLIGGGSGSKIIVTTRSERVASIMGTDVVHRLSELSEGDCWNLFKGRAFKEGEEEVDSELVEIGRDIAKKCVGVPLAAKTLGGLCFQVKKQMWEFVRDSDVWRHPEEKNGILCALRISYNHLSFYLKQCFAYCSIFPKDYVIYKDTLIRLWIAQGFVLSSGDNQSLEDIGNEYIEALMWRSFFQEPKEDGYGNLIYFKMHDLVHDLAQFVAGAESFTVFEDKKDGFPQGVRHLFFNVEGLSSPFQTPGVIPKPSNIRTLMFEFKMDFPIDIIFSSLKFLRVLKFRNDNTDHLPNSIDELKHLRYLEIEGKEIKTLPESIANLQNLQVLKLSCPMLENLPNRIQNMISLRHIDIWEGHFENPTVSHMPRGLEKLKSLQTLPHFVVGKDKGGCLLNGLNGLTDLGGSLKISNLENVKNAEEESRETNLKTKRKLQMLKLVWRERDEDDTSRATVGFKVLQNLEPPSALKNLEIDGYVGTSFPRWMMELSSSLVEIRFSGCRKCERLFPLSHLLSLKVLELFDMDGLECIEGRPEENHNKESWFPSLTTLKIRNCGNLESWFAMEAQEQVLSLPISFPSLLGTRFPRWMMEVSSSLPNVVDIQLWNCKKCKRLFPFSYLPFLKVLELMYMDGLECIEGRPEENHNKESWFPSLKTLSIASCRNLESWFPMEEQQVLSFPSLKNLYIRDCPKLKNMPLKLPSVIEHLTLHSTNAELVQSLVLSPNSSLDWLTIEKCGGLESWPNWLGPHLTSLWHLNIGCTPSLPFLPQQIQHLPALQHLIISDYCEEALPEWNMASLLQSLSIHDCPNLQILPEWVLTVNTTIQILRIIGCPHLMHRYNKETGEDRHKIF